MKLEDLKVKIDVNHYIDLINKETVDQMLVADHKMMQELFKINEELAAKMEDRSRVYSALKMREVDVKIKESEAVALPEFDSLKNETKRSAYRRLASEKERRCIAQLESDLETCNMELKRLEKDRESIIYGIVGIRHKIDIICSTMKMIGGFN